MAIRQLPREVSRCWIHGKLYVQQMKKCGKSNCRKCPHGPYWSKVRAVVKNRPILQYIGKHLPDSIEVERLVKLSREDLFTNAGR
jgi:hypothetical protein